MASYARLGPGQVCQVCKPQTLTVTSLSMQTSAFLYFMVWASSGHANAILEKTDQFCEACKPRTLNITFSSICTLLQICLLTVDALATLCILCAYFVQTWCIFRAYFVQTLYILCAPFLHTLCKQDFSAQLLERSKWSESG